MQVAGHTYPYRTRDFTEALDQLQGIGFEAVEVWIGHLGADPSKASRELRLRGLTVAALSAGGFYERKSPVAAQAFAFAQEIGTTNVVACVPPELLEEVAAMAPPGVRLCVENHWDQPLSTALAVHRAIRHYPDVAACLDTGHAILAGVSPERFAARLGARLGHLHLKDARTPSAFERLLGRRLRRRLLSRPPPVPPGRGDLNLGRLAAALAQDEYGGTVTMEYEGREPTPALQVLLADWKAAWFESSKVS